MRSRSRLVALVLALACLGSLPAACGGDGDTGREPARVEPVEGAEAPRIVLEADAARRLGIETAPVAEAGGVAGSVPYAALLYTPDGDTWVYASPEPLVFARARVEVERIEGDTVLLRSGPPPGTPVATVGVAELYGTELGIE